MKQSKIESIIEAITQSIFEYCILLFICPNIMEATAVFFIASIIRGYFIRRLFNK